MSGRRNCFQDIERYFRISHAKRKFARKNIVSITFNIARSVVCLVPDLLPSSPPNNPQHKADKCFPISAKTIETTAPYKGIAESLDLNGLHFMISDLQTQNLHAIIGLH